MDRTQVICRRRGDRVAAGAVSMGLVAAGLAVALLLTGCEKDDKSDREPNLDLAGAWSFSFNATDQFIAYNDTPLRVAAAADGWSVSWMSETPNGWMTLDTNTLTVILHVTSADLHLELNGSVERGGTRLSGDGTLEAHRALRRANWSARR